MGSLEVHVLEVYRGHEVVPPQRFQNRRSHLHLERSLQENSFGGKRSSPLMPSPLGWGGCRNPKNCPWWLPGLLCQASSRLPVSGPRTSRGLNDSSRNPWVKRREEGVSGLWRVWNYPEFHPRSHPLQPFLGQKGLIIGNLFFFLSFIDLSNVELLLSNRLSCLALWSGYRRRGSLPIPAPFLPALLGGQATEGARLECLCCLGAVAVPSLMARSSNTNWTVFFLQRSCWDGKTEGLIVSRSEWEFPLHHHACLIIQWRWEQCYKVWGGHCRLHPSCQH